MADQVSQPKIMKPCEIPIYGGPQPPAMKYVMQSKFRLFNSF